MIRNSRLALIASSGALAIATLSGCAGQGAMPAAKSASAAQTLREKGSARQAIGHAEAAVLAEPQNAAYRATLGFAYLDAGRFESAQTAFDDAMTLGERTPHTALGLALAAIALGDNQKALATLREWRADIPPVDLGLAVALAGDPTNGVKILASTLRTGEPTARLRQNLAYACALQGNWTGAQVMAAQDVSPAQIRARLLGWAKLAQPELYRQRVAQLIGAPLVADPGMPAQLALANNPTVDRLAAEAGATTMRAAASEPNPANTPAPADARRELPPLAYTPIGAASAGR